MAAAKIVLYLTIISSLLLSSPVVAIVIDSEHFNPFRMISYKDILEELNGVHLRFAASHYPNVMIIEPSPHENGSFRYSGFSVDAVDYMSQAFNFTYSFVNSPKEDLKQLGLVNSEIKLLMNENVDVVTTDVTLFLARFSRFDVSVPLYTAGAALMVPWPDEESRLLAPIHPFQPMVWLVLLIMIPTMGLVLTSIPEIRLKLLNMRNITHTNKDDNNDRRVLSISTFSEGVLSYFANITGHSSTWLSVLILKHRQLDYRILLGSWFLAVFVLVNAYSSLLISYLTIPILMPAAKNYDDLAIRRVQNLGFIAEKRGLSANFMFNATDDGYRNTKHHKRSDIFAEYFRQYPENLFTTPQQRFDLMFNGKFGYGLSELLFYTFLNELNTKAGYCKFTVSCKHMNDIKDYQTVFLYRKNWRYTDAMRNKMQWWTDTGLVRHWIKSYQPSAKDCLLEDYKKNVPAIRVLTLRDLSSAFVVLLIGYAVSFPVFLIEKIRYKFNIRRG